MRILFALHQFFPEFSGGTEKVALNLARASQRAGHYVHVIAATVIPDACGGKPSSMLEGALETTYQGVPVTYIPRSALPSTADYSFETDEELAGQLAEWLRQNHFNLVHVLHPMRMGSLILAVQRSGIPYLLTLTDFFLSCFLINRVNLNGTLCPGSDAGRRCAGDCLLAPWTPDSLERRHRQAKGLLSSASLRICPSEFVARHYLKEFAGLEFKVIPHGIDFLSLLSVDPVATPRRNNTVLTLGFIGTIVPQKGLDLLLQALARVENASLRLLVAGGMHGDPAYSAAIRNLTQADVRVELLGRLESGEITELMQKLDVLCLPSRVPETFSLVLHEAAVAGVPALVSDLGAPAEYVALHGSGKCLPVDDVTAWSDAIQEMLQQSWMIDEWRSKISLPLRVEEEAFFYESLYWQTRKGSPSIKI